MGKKKRLKLEDARDKKSSRAAPRSALKELTHPDRRYAFLVSLGLWCLLLWIFQFDTLAKISRVVRSNVYGGSLGYFSRYISQLNSQIGLDKSDAFLFFLLAALPIYMVYLETRFHALKGAWESLLKNTWKRNLFLSIFFISLCRFAIGPGEFSYFGDGAPYLGGADEFWHSLKLGSFADYSTLFYSGWNCRQYMGNLFAIVAGALEFITGSHLGVKLVLLFGHALSGIGMFLWLEKLTRNRYAALFGALAFCLNFWHFNQIFIMGRLHLSIVYACLPWTFYFVECGLADNRFRLRNFLLSTLPVAAAVYVHFVWGSMLWGLLITYSVLRISGRLKGVERISAFLSFALSVAFQALLTVGLITAPFVQKKESAAYYSIGQMSGGEQASPERIYPNVLYQWFNGHWEIGTRPAYETSWVNAYLGIIPLLFAVLGLLALLKRYRADRTALGWISLCTLGSAAVVFFYFRLIKVPGLSLLQVFPAPRYQTFLVFFMAAGSAFGVLVWLHAVNSKYTGRKKNFLGVLPLVLLAVDVGSTSFQIPFAHNAIWLHDSIFFDRYTDESQSYADKKENVPYHLFVQGLTGYDYTLRIPSLQASLLGMPSDQGPQPQTASRMSKFSNTFYDWLTPHQKQVHVFPDTFSFNYFYLNNFRDAMLLQDSDQSYDRRFLPHPEGDDNYVHVQFSHHTPIIASSVIQPHMWKNVEDASELAQLFSDMHLNYENGTAGRIFTQTGIAPDSLAAPEKLSLELLDYKVFASKYAYHVRLNEPAYVRLAASYYSFLKVSLDGQKTTFYPGAVYEVVLKVPAGDHEIEVEGGWDPYRKKWLFITWIAFAVLGFLMIRYPAGLGKKKQS